MIRNRIATAPLLLLAVGDLATAGASYVASNILIGEARWVYERAARYRDSEKPEGDPDDARAKWRRAQVGQIVVTGLWVLLALYTVFAALRAGRRHRLAAAGANALLSAGLIVLAWWPLLVTLAWRRWPGSFAGGSTNRPPPRTLARSDARSPKTGARRSPREAPPEGHQPAVVASSARCARREDRHAPASGPSRLAPGQRPSR